MYPIAVLIAAAKTMYIRNNTFARSEWSRFREMVKHCDRVAVHRGVSDPLRIAAPARPACCRSDRTAVARSRAHPVLRWQSSLTGFKTAAGQVMALTYHLVPDRRSGGLHHGRTEVASLIAQRCRYCGGRCG